MDIKIKNEILYSSTARVTGGREGLVESTNPQLSIKLSLPEELGGAGGEGSNPEQLFAAAYGACLLEALKSVALEKNLTLSKEVFLNSTVSVGNNGNNFYIEVELKVTIPGIETPKAQELIDRAVQVWPYAKAKLADIQINIVLTK